MAEQTFRSPGFFEQEIDATQRQQAPVGIPAGIIGTAEKGPAFVPVTVGSQVDFEAKFGKVDINRFGPYAVQEFLKNRDAVTYMRVLGAGSVNTAAEISNVKNQGVVAKAGFVISASAPTTVAVDPRAPGDVQFITALHSVNSDEDDGFPVFTDNDSFGSLASNNNNAPLVRAALFTTTGSRIQVMNHNEVYTNVVLDDLATVGTTGDMNKRFKIIISSSQGQTFGDDDGFDGLKIVTASLDPADAYYITRVLNTDPDLFETEQHMLYLDFAVEDALASVMTTAGAVQVCSGSTLTSADSPVSSPANQFENLFGRYDTRYQTPRTTEFISQPFGKLEYPLFHFETLSDGEYGNTKFKVSIANLRASTDENNEYGTFEVQIRAFGDTDNNTQILESFPDCTLDPRSDRYVGKQVGDKKVYFNWDTEDEDERRLVISGKSPNRSQYVRIVMHPGVENRDIPASALPFGFEGIPVTKTTDTLAADTLSGSLSVDGKVYGETWAATGTGLRRLHVQGSGDGEQASGSIVPPLPFRFKVTRGPVDTSGGEFTGEVGASETINPNLYWGVKFTRMPTTAETSNPVIDTNISSQPNPLVSAYSKFQGISKLDTLVTGAGASAFNNNKFTLARVALYNTLNAGEIGDVSGSANTHMLQAAYIRNGVPDAANYTIEDLNSRNRITFATLVNSSSVVFNKFTSFAKFTNMFYGGFDGLNILDKDNRFMKDRASSVDAGGKASDSITGGLGLSNTSDGSMNGTGVDNNCIFAYRQAIKIMTDPMAVNTNILAVPGIRDSLITDLAMQSTREYSKAIYLMDIAHYDADATRLFDDDTARRNVQETADQFEARAVDNNYSATYFPDVFINDPVLNRITFVPSSVAALGALGFNDAVSYPWFAPAGFNRGALDFVRNSQVRLTAGDRDTLYDSRINPIATFPGSGFVIFGQKTLQMRQSALDRVNVRRMLLEVKRLVVNVAERLLFEQNTPAVRARFVGQVSPLLALIQTQQGIESFRVIMDNTNNTVEDVENNRLNGRIVVVPTRAVEFVAIDFILTNAGVEFV